MMTRRKGGGRATLAALVILLALSVGSAANAYWKAGGTGAGSGATTTNLPVALSPGTPTAGLYPGGQANVVLSVSNPNLSPVSVGSLSLATGQGTGGFAVDGGHSGCSVAALSFTTQTNGGAGWTVPGKVGAVNGTLSITLTNAIAMSAGAANACQGATITVYLTAGP